MSESDPYLQPVGDSKWYVDDAYTQLADKLAHREGLYELIKDHTAEALVVTEIAKIFRRFDKDHDPGRGSKLLPKPEQEAQMFEEARGYIEKWRRGYIAKQMAEQQRRLAQMPVAVPVTTITRPSLFHRHDYKELHTYTAYSRKLRDDVEISQQRCDGCRAERQVVRRDGIFGMRTIRIRRVPPGTYT